jgi:hypothetical protein
MVTRQVAVPEHAPDQPTKRAAPTGWARRVTWASRGSASEQRVVQVVCDVPTTMLPGPEITTDSVGRALVAPAAAMDIASTTTAMTKPIAATPSTRRPARITTDSRRTGAEGRLRIRTPDNYAARSACLGGRRGVVVRRYSTC